MKKRMGNIMFMWLCACFVCASGFFVLEFAHASPSDSNIVHEYQSADPAYVLGPEDQIRVVVFGEEGLSGFYKLDGHGFISMPLIGQLLLKGMSVHEVESLVESRLLEGYLIDPSVSIEISKHRPFYILGEVRAPGRYDYVTNMSVFNAVAMAGGFTYRADQDHVKVRRPEAGQFDQAHERGLSAKVNPGDIIIVEERFF